MIKNKIWMKNSKTIFILSIICLTIIFFIVYQIKFVVSNKTNGDEYLRNIYVLTNYNSSSYETQNLQQRLDRLYIQYLKDKQVSKKDYYHNGKIKIYWQKKCISNLRRISVIFSKIEIIEKVIILSIKDEKEKQKFDLLIEQNGYHEKLMDMSNYYAQFISDDIYNSLQTTLD